MPMDAETERVIESVEKRVEDHIATTNNQLSQTNSKLDVLIDLTRQMATLQERQNRHTDEIAKMHTDMVETRKQFMHLVDKIDSRLDAYQTDTKNSIDRLHTRIAETSKSQENKCDANKQQADKLFEDLETKHHALNDYVVGRKNFLNGAIWVLGLVFLIAQGMAISYYQDFKTESKATVESIHKLEQRFVEIESRFDMYLSKQK